MSQDTRALPFSVIADDFGLHPRIDEGILELAREKKLSGVSVLCTSVHFSKDRTLELFDTGVSVGVHLALTETTARLSSLGSPWQDGNGAFRPSWRRLLPHLLSNRLPRTALHDEWLAQATFLQELAHHAGHQVAFADSHQNVHLLPHTATVMRSVCAAAGISRIRVFYDGVRLDKPVRSLLACASRALYPDDVSLPTYGIFASGALNRRQLSSILRRARRAGRPFALMTHPGREPTGADEAPRPAYRLAWEEERALLSSGTLAEELGELGLCMVRPETLAGKRGAGARERLGLSKNEVF